jgi:hypothetical protein
LKRERIDVISRPDNDVSIAHHGAARIRVNALDAAIPDSTNQRWRTAGV